MSASKKKVHIITGGTVDHVRPHLAVCSVAYGEIGRTLAQMCQEYSQALEVVLHQTKMACAGKSNLETNEDVEKLLNQLIEQSATKIIFLTTALVDFSGEIPDGGQPGKYGTRLQSRRHEQLKMILRRKPKLVGNIRLKRPDVFLVACKTTAGQSQEEMYNAGMRLLKGANCSMVLVNDIHTRWNMIITADGVYHHLTQDRQQALRHLMEMAYMRS